MNKLIKVILKYSLSVAFGLWSLTSGVQVRVLQGVC
jgi:hypothetical protein